MHRQGSPFRKRNQMNLAAIGAALSLVIWIVLTFILALPSGWVHAPLIVAVLLIVRAIVVEKPGDSDLPVGE